METTVVIHGIFGGSDSDGDYQYEDPPAEYIDDENEDIHEPIFVDVNPEENEDIHEPVFFYVNPENVELNVENEDIHEPAFVDVYPEEEEEVELDVNPEVEQSSSVYVDVPPSPTSLEAMYDYAKTQHLALKNNVMELFKHLIPHCGKDFISQMILQEEPLLKAYDLYLEANKKMSIPIVVLFDSTTSASIDTVPANGGVNGANDDAATTTVTQAN